MNDRRLAESVATLGAAAQQMEGSHSALALVVAALVRSHPDPARFAEEFRRLWLQAGSLHSSAEAGELALERIGELLSMIEDACAVPLNVRPPRR